MNLYMLKRRLNAKAVLKMKSIFCIDEHFLFYKKSKKVEIIKNVM